MIEFLRNPRGFLSFLRAYRAHYQTPKHERPDAPAIDLKPAAKFDQVRYTLAESPMFFTSVQHLRQGQRADYYGVLPEVQLFGARLIEELRSNDMPFFVVEAYRTPQRQTELRKSGGNVTFLSGDNAPHPRGCALDIVHATRPYKLSDIEYEYVGLIGKRIAERMNLNMEWGGDWRMRDMPHWQLANWRDFPPLPPNTGAPITKMPRAILREFAGLEVRKIAQPPSSRRT